MKKTIWQIIWTIFTLSIATILVGPIVEPINGKWIALGAVFTAIIAGMYCFYNIDDDLDVKNGGGR